MDEAAVVRQDVVDDVAEVLLAVAFAVGGDDVDVVPRDAEGGDGEEIVPAQEIHDVPEVERCNFADCSPHIDYFGTANVVDTGSSPKPGVEQGAE